MPQYSSSVRREDDFRIGPPPKIPEGQKRSSRSCLQFECEAQQKKVSPRSSSQRGDLAQPAPPVTPKKCHNSAEQQRVTTATHAMTWKQSIPLSLAWSPSTTEIAGGQSNIDLPSILKEIRQGIQMNDRVSLWPSSAPHRASEPLEGLSSSRRGSAKLVPKVPSATHSRPSTSSARAHAKDSSTCPLLHQLAREVELIRSRIRSETKRRSTDAEGLRGSQSSTRNSDAISQTSFAGDILKMCSTLLSSVETLYNRGDTCADAAGEPLRVPEVIRTFVDETIPRAIREDWETFSQTVLPQICEHDVREAWEETIRTLEAVDKATAARVDTLRQEREAVEKEWQLERSSRIAELRTMESLAVVGDESLEFMDRRFVVLFERHAAEHEQIQEAKSREELWIKLLRNEKVLKSEIRALEQQLDAVTARKTRETSRQQKLLTDALEKEEEMKQEMRGYLRDKQWLHERRESVKLRFEEETARKRSIQDEIQALKLRCEDESPIHPGPSMTPRPSWSDRAEPIQSFRLPAPKDPKVAPRAQEPKDLSNDDSSSTYSSQSSPTHSRVARRGGSNAMTRSPSLSGSSNAGLDALKRVTSAIAFLHRSSRPSLLRMARSMSGAFEDGGSDGLMRELDKKAVCESFADFSQRLRERLAAQTELLKLAQEHVATIKREHQSAIDLASNVCALNNSTTASMLSKTVAAAVTTTGACQLTLPAPSWDEHELVQRCLALWAAVVDQLMTRGDIVLSPEKVSLERLRNLVARRQESAASTLLARAAAAATNRSSVRSGSADIARHRMVSSASTQGEDAEHTGGASSTMTFLQALNPELQLAQLIFMLERHLEVFLVQFSASLWGAGPSSPRGGGGTGTSPATSPTAASSSGGQFGGRRAVGGLRPTVTTDLLKPIRSVGVDSESNIPLQRVCTAMSVALLAQRAPVLMIADLGLFFHTLEAALKQLPTASSYEAPFASLEGDRSVLVSVTAFRGVVETVCDSLALGCQSVSEIMDTVLALAAHGDGVPSLFGTIEHSHCAADPLDPRKQSVKSSVVTTATSGISGSAHRAPSANAKLPEYRVTVSRVATTLSPISDSTWTVPQDTWFRFLQPTGESSPTTARRSLGFEEHSPGLGAVHHPYHGRDSVTHGKSSSSSPVSPSLPQGGPQGMTPHAKLAFLAPFWKPLLDTALMCLQVQHHRLLMLCCRVVVETSLPSEKLANRFVASCRTLEETFSLLTVVPDDPVFRDFSSMMDYYVRFPPVSPPQSSGPQRVPSSGTLSTRQRRVKSVVTLDVADTPVDGGSLHDKGPTMWRIDAKKLCEALLREGDVHSGFAHFFSGGPISRAGNDGPSPNRGAWLQAAGEGSQPSSPMSAQDSAAGATPTPLGSYLRFAVSSSAAAGASASNHQRYVWKAATSRPALEEDYYDADELYSVLCKLPLRQLLIRC